MVVWPVDSIWGCDQWIDRNRGGVCGCDCACACDYDEHYDYGYRDHYDGADASSKAVLNVILDVDSAGSVAIALATHQQTHAPEWCRWQAAPWHCGFASAIRPFPEHVWTLLQQSRAAQHGVCGCPPQRRGLLADARTKPIPCRVLESRGGPVSNRVPRFTT